MKQVWIRRERDGRYGVYVRKGETRGSICYAWLETCSAAADFAAALLSYLEV